MSPLNTTKASPMLNYYDAGMMDWHFRAQFVKAAARKCRLLDGRFTPCRSARLIPARKCCPYAAYDCLHRRMRSIFMRRRHATADFAISLAESFRAGAAQQRSLEYRQRQQITKIFSQLFASFTLKCKDKCYSTATLTSYRCTRCERQAPLTGFRKAMIHGHAK